MAVCREKGYKLKHSALLLGRKGNMKLTKLGRQAGRQAEHTVNMSVEDVKDMTLTQRHWA